MFSACETFHPEAELPSYLRIDKIDVSISKPTEQGSASHKITDAWVLVNDRLKGVYELPRTFPLLYSGKHNLKIFAGINQNGKSETKVIYPFYTAYVNDSSFVFTPEGTVLLNPLVTYHSSTKFEWIEDFESVSTTIDSLPGSSTNIGRTTQPNLAFEGTSSGFASLNANKQRLKCVSSKSFVLPVNGTDVYLELNYKINALLTIGIIVSAGAVSSETIVNDLYPTIKEDGSLFWNKRYINLTPAIVGYASSANFRIFFSAESSTDTEYFFDNIKLIHF